LGFSAEEDWTLKTLDELAELSFGVGVIGVEVAAF
jgi:hypothetical protein